MTHGTWIPKAVLERVDIPLSARVLYGLIDALDGNEGCYASNGWIATNLALTPRQVQNLIKTLIDTGLVVRLDLDGKRILRTVEKQALVALKGDAANFVPATKPISPPHEIDFIHIVQRITQKIIITPYPFLIVRCFVEFGMSG